MRNFLFLLVVVAFLSGFSVAALCPPGDLNGDCEVNWDDLIAFSGQWLSTGQCGVEPTCANFDGLNGVDFADFVVLASHWLEGMPLVINEFIASNDSTSGISDPQGDYDDWIEIYNFGDTSIDLAGMYLTDDLDTPTKWHIPSGYSSQTTVPAGEFVVFWADEDTLDGPLHADFKLSAGGEDIGLFNTDGSTPIDTLTFATQTTNISYGRSPDGGDDWRFFPTPTLGDNNIGGYLGEIEDVEFSHDRGFYNASFNLTMASATPGVSIYYTTDGKPPIIGEAAAAGAILYSVPVAVSSTKCIRAAAIKTGWMPTDIDTQTYIFVNDVINQSPNGQAPGAGWPTGSVNGQSIDYGMDPDVVVNDARYTGIVDDALLAIPSISLVTDLNHLFNSGTGIYVNAVQDGELWERPVSMELINPDGSDGFQINCGMRIRGGWSVVGSNPKHAFRLFFRSEYGDEKLRFPLFGDEGADEFEKMDLRTSQNFSWSYLDGDRCIMNRDVFSRDLQREMGQPYTRSRYYHLYINGQYWGLFQTQERSEAKYAETYFGGNSDDYDVIKIDSGYPYPEHPYTIEATDGNLDAYEELYDIAMEGFSDNEAYYRVQGLNTDGTRNPAYKVLVEIDNLIDYMIVTLYGGNTDSVNNNWWILRNRNGEEGFRFFAHDSEWTLLNLNENLTGVGCSSGFINFHIRCLHSRLAENAEYRLRFADHVHKHLANDGILTPSNASNLFMDRANEINMAIIAESARWGDSKVSTPRTKDNDWLPTINDRLNNYFPYRTGILLNQLRTRGWYPSIDPPAFSQHGGHVSDGFSLTMTNPNGTGTAIYYTLDGSDPRLGGGTGTATKLVLESAAKKVKVPTSTTGTTWRGGSEPYDDSSWTSGSGGVGYERDTSGSYDSFIGLDVETAMYNVNSTCYIRIPFSVDGSQLANYTGLTLRVRYDDGFVAYINGSEVTRGNFTGTPAWNSSTNNIDDSTSLLSFDISSYISTLHAGSNILAIQGINTSAGSSDFLISAELEAVAAAPNFSPGAIQYTGAFTLNKSTDLKARVYQSSDSTWSALNEAVFEVGNIADKLRITEMMYHPDDPNAEYVELKNISSGSINLNLVKFTKGIDFTFGNVALAAGDSILVVKDIAVFQAKYGDELNVAGQYSGSLDNSGERIRLDDAIGNAILDFEYKDGWRSIADGDGYSLTIINPAHADTLRWGYKDSWRTSAYVGGSPGADDSGIIPNPGAIVIHEVLAHAHAEAPDWIELYNTTASPINISGWYLSDNETTPLKYRFAAGTVIPGHDYWFVTETANFGQSATDPGRLIPFALSENGEEVCLTSAMDANSVLTGYRTKEDFGSSETGVSFGRYYKASTGTYNFVPMASNTSGAANSSPKVGPIVISEIMYNPDWPAGGSYVNNEYEYIELYNPSGSSVTLYDSETSLPWKFTGGIDYTFPTTPIIIPSLGRILVVKNPAAFSWRYPGVSSSIIYGPYSGKLANEGEQLELSKPGDVDELGVRQYIRVERVNYSDGLHPGSDPVEPDLWPTAADGNGKSLGRINAALYGNDPNNWQAVTPAPGV